MADCAVRLHRAGDGRNRPAAVELRRAREQLQVARVVADADGHRARADAGEEVAFRVNAVVGVHVRPEFERLVGFRRVQRGGFAVAVVVFAAHLQQHHREAAQRTGRVGRYRRVHRQGEAHVVLVQPGQHALVQIRPRFGQVDAQLAHHVLPVNHDGEVHRLRQGVHAAAVGVGHEARFVELARDLLKIVELGQIHHGFAEGELAGQVVVHRERHVRRCAGGHAEQNGVD